jgi:hypothetical protein
VELNTERRNSDRNILNRRYPQLSPLQVDSVLDLYNENFTWVEYKDDVVTMAPMKGGQCLDICTLGTKKPTKLEKFK